MGYDKLINAIKAYHINIDRKNAGQVCSLVMHSNPAKLQEDGSFSTASMESVLEVYSDINAFLDRFAERAIKEAKKGDIQFAMSVFKFFEHEQYPDCHDICAKDKERCRRELEAGDFDCYWAKGYLEHWRWLELVHETCVDVQLFAKSALQNGMTIRTEVGAFTLPLQFEIQRQPPVKKITVSGGEKQIVNVKPEWYTGKETPQEAIEGLISNGITAKAVQVKLLCRKGDRSGFGELALAKVLWPELFEGTKQSADKEKRERIQKLIKRADDCYEITIEI